MNAAVALDDLARAMARREAPMPAEHALTIALQAVEAMGFEPVVLDPSGVEIDGDGVVRLTALCPAAADDREAQVGVMSLLESVLTPMPSKVAALTARLRSQTTLSHAALVAEVAAVAPADRAEARRALGRMVQEFYRPAREKAEAEEAARRAAAPAADAASEVVRALIAEAQATAAEAAVLPGRQAVVNITGGEAIDRGAAEREARARRERAMRRAAAAVLGLAVALGLAALAWSRMRG